MKLFLKGLYYYYYYYTVELGVTCDQCVAWTAMVVSQLTSILPSERILFAVDCHLRKGVQCFGSRAHYLKNKYEKDIRNSKNINFLSGYIYMFSTYIFKFLLDNTLYCRLRKNHKIMVLLKRTCFTCYICLFCADHV